ncbi:hypothetical protein V1387_08820 [Allomuricauda taeanensis]|uniref:hypothetical protein n=1 Tax=Flagellimonas taeanensis TaxID=1005926 RepID=UPI002E7C136B|nr:hypothetical protein [Allomuricauda taeanensis]MEE1962783.1 hypothetical protein [Allomuricauda taeanensis]
MRINLIIDKGLNIDFTKLEFCLNKYSKSIEFKVYENQFQWKEEYIVYPRTHIEIFDTLSQKELNSYINFLFTDVQYINNFFYEGYENLVPFSLFGWDYLTNLPIENGVLFFTVSYLARLLENAENRHYENIGCVYDFLGDKRGIDDAMRQASFCKNCLERLNQEVLTENDEKLLDDLKTLMNLLSTSSKWNKSIYEQTERKPKKMLFKRKAIIKKEINVVIASPGDLIEERELLIDKLERKFRTDKHEEMCKHRLKVHGWEDLASQNGYPQDVINERIIHNMDIVLAIFKHKLGSPTINQETGRERYPSGTAEEILYAIDNKNTDSPLGMIYFYSKPPSPSFEAENYNKLKSEWDRLKAFKQSIGNKVIYKPFTSKEELIELASRDLMINISELYEL